MSSKSKRGGRRLSRKSSGHGSIINKGSNNNNNNNNNNVSSVSKNLINRFRSSTANLHQHNRHTYSSTSAASISATVPLVYLNPIGHRSVITVGDDGDDESLGHSNLACSTFDMDAAGNDRGTCSKNNQCKLVVDSGFLTNDPNNLMLTHDHKFDRWVDPPTNLVTLGPNISDDKTAAAVNEGRSSLSSANGSTGPLEPVNNEEETSKDQSKAEIVDRDKRLTKKSSLSLSHADHGPLNPVKLKVTPIVVRPHPTSERSDRRPSERSRRSWKAKDYERALAAELFPASIRREILGSLTSCSEELVEHGGDINRKNGTSACRRSAGGGTTATGTSSSIPQLGNIRSFLSMQRRKNKKLKIVLPHVGLVVLCVLYTLLGAAFFLYLERPEEEKTRKESLEKIQSRKSRCLEELWSLTLSDTTINEKEWKTRAVHMIDNITEVLFEAFEARSITANNVLLTNGNHNSAEGFTDRDPYGELTAGNASAHPYKWTWPSAIFFSATTITTIGYGNLVPQTQLGRVVCVFFGLFGIPLMLVTIADIGKFIGECIVESYENYLLLRQRLRVKIRKGRQMILPPVQRPIPTLLVLGIIIGYIALGGALLPYVEEWNFWNSFYFSFITVSTIGFGDLVPQNQGHYVLTLIYILLGLAISTMCVDLVGSEYIQKIHFFGRKIQNARAALRTVGDLVRYTHFLKRKYTGVKEADLRKLVVGTDWEEYMGSLTPYVPKDINQFFFIDQSGRSGAPTVSSLTTSSGAAAGLHGGIPTLPHHHHHHHHPHRHNHQQQQQQQQQAFDGSLPSSIGGGSRPSTVFDLNLPKIDSEDVAKVKHTPI